jgi:hypothetical protein
LSLRFQADADLNPEIARGLRRREPVIDFRGAGGVIPDGASDPEVLRIAAEARRVLVSRDVTTMPSHFRQFIEHKRISRRAVDPFQETDRNRHRWAVAGLVELGAGRLAQSSALDSINR